MGALYRKITTTVNPQTVTLTEDALNSNQNVNVIEFDLTLGSCTLNLPSLASIFFGSNSLQGGNNGVGGGGVSFRLGGNILAGAAPKSLVLTAGGGDTICGDTTVTLNGVGTCFVLYVAGLHEWGLNICTPEQFACFVLNGSRNFVILTGGALTVGTAAQPIASGSTGENTLTGTFGAFGSGSNTVGLTAGSPQVLDAISLYNQVVAAGLAGLNLGGGAVNLGTISAGGGNFAPGSFHPGAYKAGGAFNTNAQGIITLSGDGCYIFYADGAFTTGAGTTIVLTNGAKASKVFWATTAALSTGAGTVFKGTFVSPAGLTTGVNINLEGRLFSAGSAAITLGAGADIFNLPLS